MAPKASLLARFEGKAGKRRLIDALLSHTLVENDRTLAYKFGAHTTLRHCPAGSHLLLQDGTDDDLFLIISGDFAISVNGRRVATRGSGLHVGEMALLDPISRRSATVTALSEAVVAEISRSSFTRIANKNPVIWQRLALQLAKRLIQRNALVANRHERPVLFIGSSREAVSVAKVIRNALRSKVSVNLWSESVFRASQVNIESLETQIPALDFAALVLSADDIVVSRGTHSGAPRDNVIFELGLFMGALGRHRTFLVKPRGVDLKIPTDLLGIIPIEYPEGSAKTLTNRLKSARAELRNIITRTGTR
jgi:CRP/FNR family transcriptional regulator, cyclic AMP receptor protein